MDTMASLITSLTRVYSTVHPGADQRKHQSSSSLAFVRGIHRRPVNSPHKWPVTRKTFPFDDVIMITTEKESTTKRSTYFMGEGQCPDIHLVVDNCKISKKQYFYLNIVSHFTTAKCKFHSTTDMFLIQNHSFALLTHWGLPYVDLDLGQHWPR